MTYVIKIEHTDWVLEGLRRRFVDYESPIDYEQWDTLKLAEQRKKELEKQRARVTVYKAI